MNRLLPRTIFVGGITGSGKTTACAEIARWPEMRFKFVQVGSTACSLGASYGLAASSIEETSSVALDEIQNLLVRTISDIQLCTPPDTIIMLDGHFVLGGIGRPTYRIPEWFFTNLGICGLLLCAPHTSEISARIQTDFKRQRPKFILESLARYAAEEMEHARFIAHTCAISLSLIRDVQDLPLALVRCL